MLADAERFLAEGARGIAAGVLTGDGEVDRARLCSLRTATGEAELVFHRAFDETAHLPEPLEALVACGVTRVLTSGGRRTAPQGRAVIGSLLTLAAGRIQVLPGAGIRPDNIEVLVRESGCTQVHGTFRGAPGKGAETDRRVVAQVRRVLHDVVGERTAAN